MAAEQLAPPSKKRGSSSRSVSPLVASPSAQSDPGPATSGSPQRLLGARIEAESPSAPTREMSQMELTHAYQHLAAQAELDKQWMSKVEGAITDHAVWLDHHVVEFRQVGPQLKLQKDLVMRELDKRLKSHTGPSPSADAELRAHVKAQDRHFSNVR